jgi:hypothetical protein
MKNNNLPSSLWGFLPLLVFVCSIALTLLIEQFFIFLGISFSDLDLKARIIIKLPFFIIGMIAAYLVFNAIFRRKD